MSRSARLLELIQVLRRHRRPVTAARIAEELAVSPRTVYRDIETLRGQGAPIDGEAGVGYVLKAGFVLPPLMFDEDELDALILGLRLAAARGDEDMERAADNALAKIAAVLPEDRKDAPEMSGLLVRPGVREQPAWIAEIREAMRAEKKLSLRYTDKKGAATERVVWPIALGFSQSGEMLAAWCEARQDFRHFRLDRVKDAARLDERYPVRRRVLFADWRMREGLDRPD